MKVIKALKYSLYLSITIVAVLLIVIIILRPHIFYPNNIRNIKSYLIFGNDFKIIDKYDLIKIGMTEQEVVGILGKTDEVDYRKYVRQTHGRSEDYGKEVPNPNKAFWYGSGDFLICIVFDNNDKVAYVNWGGT